MNTVYNAILSFLISLFALIIASNTNNLIYAFLDKLSLNSFHAAGLSLCITLFTTILQGILRFLKKYVIKFIDKFFGRISIECTFYLENENDSECIYFTPVKGTYVERQINVDISIKPSGTFIMWLSKKMKIGMTVFFNPNIVDIILENDDDWMDRNTQVVKFNKNKDLIFEVLRDYRINESSKKSFMQSESFKIKPKRIKHATANIQVQLTDRFGGYICKIFSNLNVLSAVDIVCEREER